MKLHSFKKAKLIDIIDNHNRKYYQIFQQFVMISCISV